MSYSEQGSQKRGRSEDEHPVGSGVGRGAGRPPGVGQVQIQDTLAAIQAQLTLQTEKMGKLAEKEDVQKISDKVEELAASVTLNTANIESCLLYTSPSPRD